MTTNQQKSGISLEKPSVLLDRRLCVAPMMDWSDRHCRFLHRLLAPGALLYTEMIVSAAVVRGNAAKLLEYDPAEHPVALQLGGCDPKELAEAARIGESFGYDEINLNVGCPSDRVREGAFGACLMLRPALVADCVRSMRDAVQVPVTVKCRIGIDDQDSYEFFAGFVDAVAAAGVGALIVHARSAILGGLPLPAPTGNGSMSRGTTDGVGESHERMRDGAANSGQAIGLSSRSARGGQARSVTARRGLSPKENREIPPLKYDYVHRLKAERPSLAVVINGGFTDAASVLAQSRAGLDGVMLGRAAYHHPLLLAELERALVDPAWRTPTPPEIIEQMVAYAHGQAARGVRLHSITRHMQGLMAGREGARAWRRFLSEVAGRPDAAPETLFCALPIVNQGLAA